MVYNASCHCGRVTRSLHKSSLAPLAPHTPATPPVNFGQMYYREDGVQEDEASTAELYSKATTRATPCTEDCYAMEALPDPSSQGPSATRGTTWPCPPLPHPCPYTAQRQKAHNRNQCTLNPTVIADVWPTHMVPKPSESPSPHFPQRVRPTPLRA